MNDYIEHMLDAAKTARGYTDAMTKAEFLSTRIVQQAVILNLIVIGEAAVQIETEFPEFAAARSAVPWKKLRGMRNRMTHGYFDTNLEIVWETVRHSLAELEQALESNSE